MENRQEKIKRTKKSFGENLKQIREVKRLSQKDVADKLGIAVSTYANWEQGRTEPGIFDICSIVKLFEIEPNELFDF